MTSRPDNAIIPVNGDVETEQFNEAGVFAEAEERGKVPRVVLVSIDSRQLAQTINVAVNATSDIGQLSNAKNEFTL